MQEGERSMKHLVASMRMALPNFGNVRMHYRQRAAVIARQRELVTEALVMHDWPEVLRWSRPTLEMPWTVYLVRGSPQIMDDDGVVASLKGVRDAFAAFVGVDDEHKDVVRYVYQDAKAKHVGLQIYVEVRGGGHGRSASQAEGFVEGQEASATAERGDCSGVVQTDPRVSSCRGSVAQQAQRVG